MHKPRSAISEEGRSALAVGLSLFVSMELLCVVTPQVMLGLQ